MTLVFFYRRIPFGHVEAGLRTWDMQTPFPEEADRVLAGRLTTAIDMLVSRAKTRE
ncbi:hypothetical protein EMIT0P74_30140 [Pseudomonas sp. IT-P74]